MTHVSLKTQIRAAVLGLSLALAPVASLAGGDDVSGQDPSTVGAGGADTAGAVAALTSTTVVTGLSGSVSSPLAGQALANVGAALEVAPPGSPTVVQSVVAAIPSLISPQVASNPPAMNGNQSAGAAKAVRTMTKALQRKNVAVPSEIVTLGASLGN